MSHGYKEEVREIQQLLAQHEHANIVLVGQRGVGSVALACEAAKMFADKRVFLVDIAELFSSAATGIEQLQQIGRVLSEMEAAGGCVVVVSGMESVIAGDYSLRFEDVLHPFISSHSVRTITTLSDEEYDEHLASNNELYKYVTVIHLNQLSPERTREVLCDTFGSAVSHELIDEVLGSTQNIFPHIPHPKRAEDVLRGILAENSTSPQKVASHISKKVGTDIRRLSNIDPLYIAECIHRRVVNQEQAVEEILYALTLSRSMGAHMKRPIASLLFAGQRGVGKTETARALAEAYFGSSRRIVRVDLQRDANQLPSIIAEHPFHVLFLVNFDDASFEVRNTYLPALHRGYITDAYERKYSSMHMIIVATSTQDAHRLHTRENRHSFDGIIPFVPLEIEHVEEVARRMLARLNGRLQIEYDVSLAITKQLVEYLARAGYSETLGAHGMYAVMQETIERSAMQAIAKDLVVPGGKILINPEQFA